MNRTILMTFALLGMSAAAAPLFGATPITYPESKKVEQVDTYHGQKVADPYRWLEDDVRTSTEVAAWVEAQNKVTAEYLNSIPERKPIADRLTLLWNYEKFTAPRREGTRYFYSRNSGLQNQFVLYTMDSLDAEPRVLLDPNTLSADGTVALSGLAFSDDGNMMAYGLATAGSDWNEWRVRDVQTGADLPDVVNWVKFGGASWTADGKGFFYSRYPEPTKGQEFQALNHFHKVYYHRVGTKQSEDLLVWESTTEPEWGFGAGVTDDGQYLVISTWKGTDSKNLVTWASLKNGVPTSRDAFTTIIDRFENDFSYVGNVDTTFYFRTDLDAPNGKLIAIDLTNPARENWKTIIPEAKEVLQGLGFVGDRFFASYLKDASTRVRVHDRAGAYIRDVEFPGIGSAGGFGGRRDYNETFYTFSSFATPPTIYRYDIATGKSTILRQAKVDMDPSAYETTQVFYLSKDGTKVPMFLTHKKGLALDGSNPTLLYAYGGFDISITPSFSPARILWMEMGGIYAVANLRGGGEYGKEWHESGKLLQKQNVFDDFIGAAEYLIAKKYTSPAKLAIQGGSNGGLLVGAVMTQRPELFGAALPAVGVMDMLRFHKFSAGRFWVDEYGSSDDPELFPYLLNYSPYHVLTNSSSGARYPSTMVTTADTDDRVVPGHSFKFAAALQEKHTGDNPVLIRIETKAGHGAGKPTSKIIEEAADIMAFLVKSLNISGRTGLKVDPSN